MATSFMNLDLPIVSTTIGPEYATKNNTAFEAIDEHNHTSGKGVQIPSAGLNINADLSFSQYKAYNLKSTQFNANSATLTGASNINSLYSVLGNLYFTNAGGSAVQITSGGSIVSSPAALSTVEQQAVSSNLVINPAATYVYLLVDTTASRQISLPLASSVAAGRVYIIKDVTGTANTNNITIVRQGSDTIDGQTSYVMNSNFGSVWCVGDSSSSWYIS